MKAKDFNRVVTKYVTEDLPQWTATLECDGLDEYVHAVFALLDIFQIANWRQYATPFSSEIMYVVEELGSVYESRFDAAKHTIVIEKTPLEVYLNLGIEEEE